MTIFIHPIKLAMKMNKLLLLFADNAASIKTTQCKFAQVDKEFTNGEQVGAVDRRQNASFSPPTAPLLLAPAGRQVYFE